MARGSMTACLDRNLIQDSGLRMQWSLCKESKKIIPKEKPNEQMVLFKIKYNDMLPTGLGQVYYYSGSNPGRVPVETVSSHEIYIERANMGNATTQKRHTY